MFSKLYEFGTNPHLANYLYLFLQSCHGCDNSCGYIIKRNVSTLKDCERLAS